MSMDRVAFCGLGIMGGPMAANLARAGFELSVYTRTREKAERFAAEHGAARRRHAARGRRGRRGRDHDGPRRARGRGGPARRAGRGARAGRGRRSRSTCPRSPPPRRARSASASPTTAIAFLEAPVSGSRPKAEDGTLTIMVGGEAGDFERARPLFDAMGERIVHVGPHGPRPAGQAAHEHDGRRPRRGARRVGARRREGRARPRRLPRGGRRQRRATPPCWA